MATATIADELTCPVCLEFYKDPRVLPCQHSLCKSCLVALLSKREKDINCNLQCPSCRYLFNAKDETHIEALPKNFTLASIVCKFQASLKGDKVFPCDLCEEGEKGRAIKKCLQCQFNYCRMCLEQLHPRRGALANHNLVHIIDAQGEEHEHEEPRSAISPPVQENQCISTHKYDQLIPVRYCLSCDEMFTKGDQMSAVGCHDHHDTTEMHTAFRTKKDEFQRTLGRLLDQDMELEKGLATITHQIEIIRKCVEEKKVELVHRFGEMTKEIESKKISAENRIEEEMKMRINSLECRLRELEDHKRRTQIKIAAFSELSSLTNEDAIIFFMKLKELQNETEPVAEDCIKQATKGTVCDSSLSIEQFMNEIIANATRDIYSSERRLQAPDPIMAATDMSPQHANMAIQVANLQNEGKMSADIEWVAIDQVDHYEMSYFCDPEETVLRRNIVENRCRLTNLRWDSNYTITVTAYQQDGKTTLDSTVFKTDPKLNDSTLADGDKSPQHAYLAIKVTSVQNEGKMSADVEWLAIDQVDHYEMSYFCDPEETVLRRNIVENRCRLTNLRWDSNYTITVTAYQQDGKTTLDSTVFKTDPKLNDSTLADGDKSPQHAYLAIKVTSVQNEGTMSADVEWLAMHQVDHYEISYFCDPEETVLRRNIVENRCRLTNLKWDATYAITVTAYQPYGKTSFDSTVFKTHPKMKVANPAISNIPPKKVKMSIKVTNVQKAGTMSADVKWTAQYQPSQYEVTYYCNPDERVVLTNITENRCRLTNLRWDSTYVVMVTTQLQDGIIGFNEKIFQTDPQVICFPMATTDICNDKIAAPSSFYEFTASDRKTTGVHYNKIGEFSGIVFSPVLTENKRFWTMNFDLSIFRPGTNRSLFLDFGIIDYSVLKYAFGLVNNKAAHTCAIVHANQRNIHLIFYSRTIQVGPTLTLNLEHKKSFSFGFFYNKIANTFAVLNLHNQEVLHVFEDVQFRGDADPVFAVTPYHTFQKMRVNGTLRYEDYLKEDLSYWMLKMKEYLLR